VTHKTELATVLCKLLNNKQMTTMMTMIKQTTINAVFAFNN